MPEYSVFHEKFEKFRQNYLIMVIFAWTWAMFYEPITCVFDINQPKSSQNGSKISRNKKFIIYRHIKRFRTVIERLGTQGGRWWNGDGDGTKSLSSLYKFKCILGLFFRFWSVNLNLAWTCSRVLDRSVCEITSTPQKRKNHCNICVNSRFPPKYSSQPTPFWSGSINSYKHFTLPENRKINFLGHFIHPKVFIDKIKPNSPECISNIVGT